MKIAAITCSVVMWLTSIFSMAVPIPYLPYVPPHDAQLWDLVFNIFGVTAPDIEDAEERAAAYWNIYRDALGAGYDAFEQDMRQMFDKAKTTGSVFLGAGTGISLGMLELGMNKAITEGVEYGEAPESPTLSEIGQYIKSKFDVIYAPYVMGTNLAESIASQWILQKNTNYKCLIMSRSGGSDGILVIAFCKSYWTQGNYYKLNTQGDVYYKISTRNYNNALNFSGLTSYDGETGGTTFATIGNTCPCGSIDERVASVPVAYVAAQSAATAAAIGAGQLVPLTGETVMNNGVIDDTKPVNIKLPLVDLPIGATEVSGLTGVQDKVDAVPNTEVQDMAETIEELKEKQAATYGDTGAFAVDLTSYFPFCIPFDLYKMLLALGAEPEAPSIDFPMITGLENGEIKTVNLHISLEFMDNLMQFVRTGELILSTLGLAFLTAKVIKW